MPMRAEQQSSVVCYPVPICARVPVSGGRPHRKAVWRASEAIRRGQVVAAPTDTLYGLLANASDCRAVQNLFRIKGRPESKPILLLIDSLARLDRIVRRRPRAFGPLAERFWPGPLTLVLPARDEVPDAVTAGTGTVAVRLPRSALVRALGRGANCPLTGTSANRSGRAGGRSADEVVAQLGNRVPLVLDAGRVRHSQPSTIVDLVSDEPRILRAGRVGAVEIERALRGVAPLRE